MNKYLRQLFTAVVALFVILGLSSTIIMAVRANALNNDPRNARSLYHQLGAYRGAILASDGTVMAKSEPVNDAFKYLRTYSNGPLYAPVTGFFSINQTADRGLEASRSMLLNGEADSLIWQRAKAMLTGTTNQGASIETSIDPKLQQVAYDQLGTRDGAAVAIEVNTGRILAMVSTPSYDPNKLATHDAKVLHDLKGREHVCRVSAEAGQFEHQNIGHVILAGFDVLHHLAELRPALDRLAGLSRILVFAGDLIIVIVCVGFHFGLLGIQRVAVHLHSGGDSGVGVNFYLLFLHLNLPHVVRIQKWIGHS